MANVYTTNPIYLDTFSADYVLKAFGTGSFKCRAISLYSDDSDTRFTLEDKDGNPIVTLGGKRDALFLGENFWFTNGVTLDVSDGDHLGGHARVLIYQ